MIDRLGDFIIENINGCMRVLTKQFQSVQISVYFFVHSPLTGVLKAKDKKRESKHFQRKR